MEDKIFGPVPSRRLGRSIGINNIPPKICSYSCSYCQIGFSKRMSTAPENFYNPEELAAAAAARLEQLPASGDAIDYLTIVPDGEPTLDANIGKLLKFLKITGIKTAVITNATMLYRPEVREALSAADWVSVKVDTVDEGIWRQIDRPHRSLDFQQHLEGSLKFADEYSGKLVTETMLVKNINDSEKNLEANADFIKQLNPEECYLSIPTRPPADSSVKASTEAAVNRAYQIYQSKTLPAEYLIGYEGNEFAATGNSEEDILSITSVHPMREDAVRELLENNNTAFDLVNEMMEAGRLIRSEYRGEHYYLRSFR
ncbi:MAG: radical SAM protein [Spirochaetales bacterium]|uniref:Radical SAM protein n=1 Tax=Candidatus Thalassospirochaeta sargassi TaxID=3119039 RepID=A0AAJ1IKV4_9SPIO|nr:radical SAM protein [Spirochaetales bacterium]